MTRLYVALTPDESLSAEITFQPVKGDASVGLRPSIENVSITLTRRWTGCSVTPGSFKSGPCQESLPLSGDALAFFHRHLKDKIEESL